MLTAALIWTPLIGLVIFKPKGEPPSQYASYHNSQEHSDIYWATVIQAISAGAMLFLVGGQICVAIRQNRLARVQTDILNRQAEIARGKPFLSIVTKEPLRAVFRVIKGITLPDGTEGAMFNETPVLQFWVKNYGNSPAIIAWVGARLSIGASAPNAQTSYPLVDMPGDRIVQSGDDVGPFPSLLRVGQQTMSRTLYGDLMAGRQFIWLYGQIRYDTVWAEYFIVHFCWRYDMGADEFGPHPPERNKTDTRPGPHGLPLERELGEAT
jgi:hypothetical protein